MLLTCLWNTLIHFLWLAEAREARMGNYFYVWQQRGCRELDEMDGQLKSWVKIRGMTKVIMLWVSAIRLLDQEIVDENGLRSTGRRLRFMGPGPCGKLKPSWDLLDEQCSRAQTIQEFCCFFFFMTMYWHRWSRSRQGKMLFWTQ